MNSTLNMHSQITLKIALIACLAASCCVIAFPAAADDYQFCGQPLGVNAFSRPLDFNDPADAEHVGGIEFNHLSRDVELLVRGVTSDSPVDDLAYILRQIPNHYRALVAMSNYQLKNGYAAGQRGDVYAADCYFRRALNFRGNDPLIHFVYGIHLHRSGDLDQALSEYLIAKKIGPSNAEVHYNLGLLYVDLEQYELAREEAKSAYELGYPLAGLKGRLDRLGEWSEN